MPSLAKWDKGPPCPSERSSDVLPQRSPLSPRTAKGTRESRAFSPPCSPRLSPRLRVSASNRTPRCLLRPLFSKVFSALSLRPLRLCVEITFPFGTVLSALRCAFLLAVLACVAAAAALPYFSVLSEDAGAWPDILSSIVLTRQASCSCRPPLLQRTTRGRRRLAGHPLLHRPPAPPRRRVADLRGAHRRRGQRRMARSRGTRRHSNPRRRVLPRRSVRLPPFPQGPGARAKPHRRAPSHPAPRLAAGPGVDRLRYAAGRTGVRYRPLDRRAHVGGPEARLRRHSLGGRTTRRARQRALSLPAERARRSRPGPALPLQPFVGLLRFRLPLAGGCGLLRGALAQGRDRRPARRRLAQFRARPRSRCLPEEPDRGLPPPGDPGVRLVRTPPRQRQVLGRASRLA